VSLDPTGVLSPVLFGLGDIFAKLLGTSLAELNHPWSLAAEIAIGEEKARG